VLGFTVMVQRRPIFLGVGRVRELDESGATLSTGTVNLRPFQQREGETLVIGELLDARVRHRETGKELRLNDVAIGRVREEWVVTALDVLEPGGGLRPWRRAKHLRLPWDQVAGLEPAESAERRVAALANLRPADLAAALQALPVQARQEVVAGLDDDRWPRPWRSCPRSSRRSCWPGWATSGRPTCWRRWTPTTPPTCWASCPRPTGRGCWP
jgi:hypothetical protein